MEENKIHYMKALGAEFNTRPMKTIRTNIPEYGSGPEELILRLKDEKEVHKIADKLAYSLSFAAPHFLHSVEMSEEIYSIPEGFDFKEQGMLLLIFPNANLPISKWTLHQRCWHKHNPEDTVESVEFTFEELINYFDEKSKKS